LSFRIHWWLPMVKKSTSKTAQQDHQPLAIKQSNKKGTVKKPRGSATKPDVRQAAKSKVDSIETVDRSFPVVGIGASAGGLEACSEFFNQLPAGTGMAFVLVQHLDPSHKSMLTELLSRTTPLPIHEVMDGMEIEPNHIYIIPPNTELGILHRVLHLLPRSKTANPPLPIDTFMQSLAEDQGSMAIGVILSGGASDGTIGLKRIKAAGGITFAQDEGSAKYNSMPHSAIAAGCVDFVLPPAEIARELVRIARQPLVLKHLSRMTEAELPDEGGDELNKILLLLRNRTGNDFTYYKHTTIRRRIQRRMVLHKLQRLKEYLRYLREHPPELDDLFQDILINVTGFFRDPESFDALKKDVFPAIIRCRRDETIRIWVAACSTGEEAYSIAMTLLEYLGNHANGTPIQIFASDIDAKAIDKARAGIYPEGIKADVSAARLQRFFTKVPAGYQISKSVRDLCLFAVQNVAKDPPFSRMDLICCRNLLIYLSNVMQKKVLQVFHYGLKPTGFLLLGGSESISGSADLFSMLDKKNKIYTKKSIASLRHYEFSSMPASVTRYSPEQPLPPSANTLVDIVHQAERLILNEYGPAAVITNQDLDILHFRGHTGPYIEPAQGSASLNLMKMARTDLLMELRSAVRQVIKEGARVNRENVRLKINHQERRVHLQVIPLKGSRSDEYSLLVLFEETDSSPVSADVAKPDRSVAEADSKKMVNDKDQRIQALEQELSATREYLQTIIEDQETSNEELQSASEEIQSANEELQSTNEELETAKEELQSTNEELITVNEELEGRNAELNQLNNDLSNLLNSVQLPIIMLNEDLSIRHFTPGATQLFNLIHSDVGRPISDIRANINIANLDERLIRVMDTVTLETLEVRDTAGNWYNLRIRPYKTMNNHITGVVMVFFGMSSAIERRLATVVRDASDAISLQDFDGNILAWNGRAAQIFGYSETEALTMNVHSLVPESARLKEAAMVAALRRGETVAPMATVRITKAGQAIKVWHTSTALIDEHGRPYAIASTERLLKDEA